MAETLSAKEVAIRLDTDARTLRKFLRDTTPQEDQPGQGGRWNFTKAEVKPLKKKFAEWQTTKVTRAAKEAPDDVEELDDEDIEEIDIDDEEVEDLDDDDEDDEELEEL